MFTADLLPTKSTILDVFRNIESFTTLSCSYLHAAKNIKYKQNTYCLYLFDIQE